MNPDLPLKVIVVGGGAAGFFAAIACASSNPLAQVTVLEAGKDFLSKVKISGGGRCNVTHHCFEPTQLVQYYPRGGKALRGAFSRFQPQDTIAWFAAHQVQLKTEADGRIFPISNDSQTIIDCLLDTAKAHGVRLRSNCPVRAVEKSLSGFNLTLKNEQILTCDRLLLATGSNPLGYRWAQELGHQIEVPVPSLFTFNLKDQRLADLTGITVDSVEMAIGQGKQKLIQTGPLLITHWGLSGPAILKLSAWGARLLQENNYQMPLIINWLPQENRETLQKLLLDIKQNQRRKQICSFSPVDLPKRLWQSLVNHAQIDSKTLWAELSKKHLNSLINELIQGQYDILGKGIFKEEFVTCGGIKLNEVDFKTMGSKKCEGLYFAGEILDIDGVTGGFNFQNAWTTGWLAGKAIAVKF